MNDPHAAFDLRFGWEAASPLLIGSKKMIRREGSAWHTSFLGRDDHLSAAVSHSRVERQSSLLTRGMRPRFVQRLSTRFGFSFQTHQAAFRSNDFTKPPTCDLTKT